MFVNILTDRNQEDANLAKSSENAVLVCDSQTSFFVNGLEIKFKTANMWTT